MLIPALLLIILSEAAKEGLRFDVGRIAAKEIFEPVVFMLSVFSALAAPLLFRLHFIKKLKDKKKTALPAFIKFEKQTLYIVLLTPYFFFAASILQFAAFYYLSIFLLSLYAGYYYYPSAKRLHFEKRLFRINNDVS